MSCSPDFIHTSYYIIGIVLAILWLIGCHIHYITKGPYRDEWGDPAPLPLFQIGWWILAALIVIGWPAVLVVAIGIALLFGYAGLLETLRKKYQGE